MVGCRHFGARRYVAHADRIIEVWNKADLLDEAERTRLINLGIKDGESGRHDCDSVAPILVKPRSRAVCRETLRAHLGLPEFGAYVDAARKPSVSEHFAAPLKPP